MSYLAEIIEHHDGLVSIKVQGPGVGPHHPILILPEPDANGPPCPSVPHQTNNIARLLGLAFAAGQEHKAAELRKVLGVK